MLVPLNDVSPQYYSAFATVCLVWADGLPLSNVDYILIPGDEEARTGSASCATGVAVVAETLALASGLGSGLASTAVVTASGVAFAFTADAASVAASGGVGNRAAGAGLCSVSLLDHYLAGDEAALALRGACRWA